MSSSWPTLQAALCGPALALFALLLPAGCCGPPDGIGRFERYPCNAACSESMAVGTRADLTTMLDDMTIETTEEGPFGIEANPSFIRILASQSGTATALVRQRGALFDHFPLRAAEAGGLHVDGVATSSITMTLGTQRSLKVTALALTASGVPGSTLAGSFCLNPSVEGAANTVAAPCDESQPAADSGAVLELSAEAIGTSTVTVYALGLQRSFVLEVKP